MTKISVLVTIVIAAALVFGVPVPSNAATDYERVLARWSKSEENTDDMGGRFIVKATLYTAEYVNALVKSEAEKNLWTASEMEDYKYNLLKELELDERIAMHLELNELGPTAHMAPFNEMLYIWIGKKKYSPEKYDERFNLPLQGKRDGMVYFPRHDEKTGEPLLKKDASIRLIMSSAISPVLGHKEVRMTWDVKAEEGSVFSGTAADRLEIDRLLRRIEKLASERADLEKQLEAKKSEIDTINARIEELQKN
ncbi:MAG: hypothetical protein LBO21_04360 [Synergistaceae bacterium]|jgi:hypothetical protein|nr:hypothetical protein [Synergistaceae bacterium]